MSLNQKSIKALENLKSHPWSADKYQTAKRSAVLVALVANSEGDLEVILTVRSSSLRTNAGDSAFPGGKCDPEDIDIIATAKREAFEEVRLAPSASETLVLLKPAISRHMQIVTPVVVYCPKMTTADISLLYPNPGEVAAIFTTPLEYFLTPRRGEYHWFDMFWGISEYRIHRFDRCGTINHIIGKDGIQSDAEMGDPLLDRSKIGWPVYGLTAGVLIEAAKIAYQREPDFEVYAPTQFHDDDLIAEWYNQRNGFQSSL